MDANRRKVYTTLNKEFKKENLSLSQIGRDIPTPSINPQTGSWIDRGLFSKTPRFLTQLRFDSSNNLEAGQFQSNPTSGKIGYINTTNDSNRVAGLLIRVLPIIISSPTFTAINHWEWALLLTFKTPLTVGGSSDTLDNFYPPNPIIRWNSRGQTKNIEISHASLFSLNPTNTTYIYNQSASTTQQTITYDQAGNAIKEYLALSI